ncbi:MAG: hypothetical protein WBQ60_07485 [Asticcacaulis sp.]
MPLKIIVLAAASLTLLSACATPTPYQPAVTTVSPDRQRGYSETRIENDRYRLSFSGNDLTRRDTVENYLLYRAAEVTVEAGYDWFEVIHRDTDESTRTTLYSDPMDSFSWRFYGRSRWSPWGRFGSAFGTDFGTEAIVHKRYEASAEIILHKGNKPMDNPTAYDARAVRANLEPRIVRPASR